MSSDPHDRAGRAEANRDLVVDLAAGILVGKGWCDEPDDELFGALSRLYDATPICQRELKFTGEVLRDLLAARPAEYLAAAWEQAQQDRWERECAERWGCPCGETFGLYPFTPARVTFYTLADDGLFLEQVSHCPRCERDLATTRADVPAGQLGFVL
jgi:hypothetical protein